MVVVRHLARWTVNFVWKITGGVVFALVWLVLGIVFSLSVIGLPFAVYCFKIAYFSYKPFGHQVVIVPTSHLLFNIIWAFSIGAIMLVISIVWLTALIISILGIPLIYEWYKVMKVSLFPIGVYIM